MNLDCHWPLKVKLMKDADYPPFRSAAIHDCAEKRGQHCPGSIVNGLLGNRITLYRYTICFPLLCLMGRFSLAFCCANCTLLLSLPYFLCAAPSA